MTYFNSNSNSLSKTDLLINARLHRVRLLNAVNIFHVVAGDILVLHFEKLRLFIDLKGFVLQLKKNHYV
jgi:hypothetical protein